MKKTKKKSSNGREVDLDNFSQVRNAASSLGTTIEEFIAASKVVGPVVEDIRKHLGLHPRNPYLHRTSRPGGWRL